MVGRTSRRRSGEPVRRRAARSSSRLPSIHSGSRGRSGSSGPVGRPWTVCSRPADRLFPAPVQRPSCSRSQLRRRRLGSAREPGRRAAAADNPRRIPAPERVLYVEPVVPWRQRNALTPTIPSMPVTLHFLGAAETVTGSQYLLDTGRAKVLVDCGMFQGTPEERIRNAVPFAYDPKEVDAMLLTHAHLDHCGQIPRLVKSGFTGPIYATAGTIELAALVLLDSGKLQQEFAKRASRWERRYPDKAASEDREQLEDYEDA